MIPELDEQAHRARAMALAEAGIASQAGGDYEAAREAWRDALDHAERHLPDDAIVPWIRSGLGDALLRNGDYRAALDMAGLALEFCASVKAPLAALTMAESCLRLGEVTRARDYARQACDLRGAEVLRVFSRADRDALGL